MADIRNSLLHFLHWRVRFVPAHFLMERTMLPGIKHRSEARGARTGELEPAG